LPNNFLIKKNFDNFANQTKFTLKYSLTNVFFFASEAEKNFAIKFFSPRPKVKRKVKYSKFKLNVIYNFNKEQHNIVDYKFLFLLLKNFKSKKQTSINKSFLL
jgi:predicted porin